MPVYESSRSNWVKEDIDLTAYSGTQVKIRFELRSDVSTNMDGWYVDDIKLFHYSIVPVELTSFTVKTSGDGRILSWSTSSETNNKGFDIERSLDKKYWSKIGFVAGSGTSTEINNYRYADNSTNGKIYYRLKQIDYDGTFTYSSIVESDGPAVTDYSLEQNYPNPFNPVTTIKFSLPYEGVVKLTVYNVLGEKVSDLINRNLQAGEHSINFDASDLNSGIYFYKLQSGSYSKTLKMILAK